MKTITMEIYDHGEEGEFHAKIEVGGSGDMDHIFQAIKAFMIAAGFDEWEVDDAMEEIHDDFETRDDWAVRLNFDRSENDE